MLSSILATMKTLYTFDSNDYYAALNRQHQSSSQIYRIPRQRGGSLGSIFRYVSRYVVPLLKKYVVPPLQSSALSVTTDLLEGGRFKETLKKHSKNLIKNIASEIAKPSQKGAGKRMIQKVI